MLEFPKRTDVCKQFKDSDGKIAAVLPIHYPRSLLRAFNILPVEVWGPPKIDRTAGSIHLQEYICSIAHSLLAFLQSKDMDIVDLVITPHACDSLQDLGGLLIDFIDTNKPVFPLYIPRGKRDIDLEFFEMELKTLYNRLVDLTGLKPPDNKLMECIFLEEEADKKLAELYKKRCFLNVNNKEFYRLVRLREYLPAEEFIDFTDKVIKECKSNNEIFCNAKIVISGLVPEPMEIFDIFDEMKVIVVADDFACSGRRVYKAGNSDNPFKRMAERIIYGPPDSTRGNLIEERIKHLKNLVDSGDSAKGVLFYIVKFCEPELFDLPEIRKSLNDAGISSLVVEVDINSPLSQQVVTRIEAFLEALM
ncbi:MAG: 2-hydroxyacyl-CoA dehydratase family protein [Deferribacterota bacterium]|nr:2-hydroxyacyl-CoA dehydratase family protein [Deferribacterota bacterium]